jgi:hypothetical protein
MMSSLLRPNGHLDRDERTVTTRVSEPVKAILTGVAIPAR